MKVCMAVAVVVIAANIALYVFSSPARSSETPAVVTVKGKSASFWHRRYRAEHRALSKHGGMVRELRSHLHAFRRSTSIGSHPMETNLLCIHAGEGSWTDPNAPYYGGLQMDMSFQRSYGPEFLQAFGTADHWPISAQIAVAMRAILSGRGYYPWPTTGRRCGLIG